MNGPGAVPASRLLGVSCRHARSAGSYGRRMLCGGPAAHRSASPPVFPTRAGPQVRGSTPLQAATHSQLAHCGSLALWNTMCEYCWLSVPPGLPGMLLFRSAPFTNLLAPRHSRVNSDSATPRTLHTVAARPYWRWHLTKPSGFRHVTATTVPAMRAGSSRFNKPWMDGMPDSVS